MGLNFTNNLYVVKSVFEMQNVRPLTLYAKSEVHNLYFRAHIYMCVLFFPSANWNIRQNCLQNGCIILHSCLQRVRFLWFHIHCSIWCQHSILAILIGVSPQNLPSIYASFEITTCDSVRNYDVAECPDYASIVQAWGSVALMCR